MRRFSRVLALAVALAASIAGGAVAQTTGLPALVRSLLLTPNSTVAGWEELDANRVVKWGQGPVLLNKPAPDGSTFARPGQATLDGRPIQLAASGARVGVLSVYIRDGVPPREIGAIAQDFRAQGFTVAKARCALAPDGPEMRGWLKLTAAGRQPLYLYAGPLNSGGQGYTLFYDELPPMSQAEAARFTDACQGGGVPAAPGGRPGTGQAVAVQALQAFLRPVGAPTTIPWSALPTVPGLTWNAGPPLKIASPYTDGGADPNPRLRDGHVKSSTTEMHAMATGDDRGANHFSLMDAQNMPPGAVFNDLQAAGFQITALRCGKAYTQMSDAWFRISGGGRQPGILYRLLSRSTGRPVEAYILRLDNLMPPMLPGQSNPVGGRCP